MSLPLIRVRESENSPWDVLPAIGIPGPKGDTGDTGVYVGQSEPPADSNANIWIDPEGSGVYVDPTLTVAGAAADAKAVGTKIANIGKHRRIAEVTINEGDQIIKVNSDNVPGGFKLKQFAISFNDVSVQPSAENVLIFYGKSGQDDQLINLFFGDIKENVYATAYCTLETSVPCSYYSDYFRAYNTVSLVRTTGATDTYEFIDRFHIQIYGGTFLSGKIIIDGVE